MLRANGTGWERRGPAGWWVGSRWRAACSWHHAMDGCSHVRSHELVFVVVRPPHYNLRRPVEGLAPFLWALMVLNDCAVAAVTPPSTGLTLTLQADQENALIRPGRGAG